MCCEGSWSIYYVYAVYVVYSRAIFDHVGMLQELEMLQLSTTGRALIDISLSVLSVAQVWYIVGRSDSKRKDTPKKYEYSCRTTISIDEEKS